MDNHLYYYNNIVMVTVLRKRSGPLSTRWSKTKKSPGGVMFRILVVVVVSSLLTLTQHHQDYVQGVL